MLASTRLPMPAVRVSESFWVKVDWIENFAAPADNLAKAELTLVSEDWIVLIKAEAFACVEMVDVVLIETMPPDKVMFCAAVVIRRVPSADARAVTWVVEPSTRLKPLNTAFFTMVEI